MTQSLRKPLRYKVAQVCLMAHRTMRRIGKAYPITSFRALLFHNIVPEQMAAFDRLLHYLINKHRIITPSEAEALLSGRPLPDNDSRIPYLLTFDDGFLSHAHIARNILDPVGAKGIFFVCPGLIDISKEQHRESIARLIFDGALTSNDLPDNIALMSWLDVETLFTAGHTIGSHSSTHRRLASLNSDEQENEILGAGKRLEERLGMPPDWFAYPFGDLPSIDQRSLDTIASQYRFCCSGIRGVNSVQVNPMGLLREQLGLEGPFEYQQLVMEGGLDFYYGARTKLLQGLAESTVAPVLT